MLLLNKQTKKKAERSIRQDDEFLSRIQSDVL